MMTSEEIVVDLNVRELIDWMLRELESDNAEIKDIQEASRARATKKQSEKSPKMTKKTTKTTTTTTTDAATAKTSTATTTTTTTTHKDETPADVSNRRVSLRVRNTNVQQQQQQEQSTAASVPANKRKLSDVLGQLAGAGGEKKQRRNTTKNPDTAATDENSSNSAKKRSLPAKRKLVEVEDKENVPPGHSVHKAARSGAAKRTIKSPPQKENAFEKILEEVSDTETTTTTTATNTKTDIEVATFMAQCAALRKLNQCVSLNGGQIVLNQTASSSTEASVTAIIGDNLNHIIASTEQQQQQQPLLPEFQTVVDGGASHAMFSDETVEQIFKNALLENTNDNNRSINQIGVNYLASDTPFFYGHEYEVYTDGTGSNVCQLVEQKVTTVSKQSETAISFTIGESSATATAAAETTSKTNVTEEDEAKPSSSSRHEEESVTNESNEGSQSEGYNLKLPENYTPESFDFNGIDLVAIEGKNLCTYAANVAKAIFTLDELSNGYIQEGLTSRKSTKKQHLDHFRVKILKDAICNRFNITEDRLDSLWKKIRHSLNLRFARIGPSLQKKSQKSE